MPMKKQEYGFGPHMMLDAYGCPEELLSNIDLIYQFMLDLTKAIKMNALGPPIIYQVKEEDITYSADTGYSTTIVFAESHLAIHTFPKKKFFVADVFSCKDYDAIVVEKMFRETFKPLELEIKKLNRGSKFPRSN